MAVSIQKFNLFRRKTRQSKQFDDNLDLAEINTNVSPEELLKHLSRKKTSKQHSTYYVEFLNRLT